MYLKNVIQAEAKCDESVMNLVSLKAKSCQTQQGAEQGGLVFAGHGGHSQGSFGLRSQFKKKETVKTVHLSWRSEDGASDADWAGGADTSGKLVARWDLLLREVTLSG